MNIAFRDFISLFPILITSILVIIITLLLMWQRNHLMNIFVITNIFIIALIYCIINKDQKSLQITDLFYINKFSNFSTILILISSISTFICSYIWFKENHNKLKKVEEYYILLTVSTVGTMLLTIANHFLSIFIGIELISLPLFGLIGYILTQNHSIEINIKYLVLSLSTSSFLLFGIGLIYIELGDLSLFTISNHSIETIKFKPLFILGVGLILMSIGFKLSFIPFQLWTPDIYQISPTPIIMFLSTASKISFFVLLINLSNALHLSNNIHFINVISIIAILTILIGNILAISQKNIKRMLSYSSISQIGYLLIPLITLKINNAELYSVTMSYIISYIFANIGIFFIITKISSNIISNDKDNIINYYGLYFREPKLTIMLTIMILSLAGIPLTLGFIAKFYIILSTIANKSWLLTLTILIGSIISLIYYLNFINILYNNKQNINNQNYILKNKYTNIITLFSFFCVFILILFGICPQYLINIINSYL